MGMRKLTPCSGFMTAELTYSTSQIYPIDVAKTVYQKALLSAGSGHAERPKIKVFEIGAYRGMLGFA